MQLFALAVQACAEVSHAVSVTAHGTRTGIAAGNDFAEYGKVGVYIEEALRTVHADPEARDDFVKDQQRAVFVRQSLRTLDELSGDRSGTGFGADGLYEDRRRAAVQLILPKLLLQILQIAGEEFVRMFENIAGNAVGKHALRSRNTDAVGKLVRPAVIAAAHLQDVLVSGLQTGDPGGDHAGLRARSQETDHFHGGNEIRDLLRELVFIFMEKTGGGAAGIQQVDHGFPDFGRIAAEDSRAAGLEQIVIFIAVHVGHLVSVRACDRDRERIVEGKVVLHAAGNDFLRFVGHLL